MGGGCLQFVQPESGSEPHYGSDSMLEHLSISWEWSEMCRADFFWTCRGPGEPSGAELRLFRGLFCGLSAIAPLDH